VPLPVLLAFFISLNFKHSVVDHLTVTVVDHLTVTVVDNLTVTVVVVLFSFRCS